MNRVIDEVAKGNFDRTITMTFMIRRKWLDVRQRIEEKLNSLSPRARALLGLTEPGVSPAPAQVVAKGPAQPPLQISNTFHPHSNSYRRISSIICLHVPYLWCQHLSHHTSNPLCRADLLLLQVRHMLHQPLLYNRLHTASVSSFQHLKIH